MNRFAVIKELLTWAGDWKPVDTRGTYAEAWRAKLAADWWNARRREFERYTVKESF